MRVARRRSGVITRVREPSNKPQSTAFGDGSAKAWNQHRFAARRPLRTKDLEALGRVRRDQQRTVPTADGRRTDGILLFGRERLARLQCRWIS